MSSLAATQSDGFYRPPEWEPKHGSLSKSNTGGKYKGSNQYEQRGVIRFELPFDGWCTKCERHISKGTRFNAKKEKAGNYFSTTIWSFTMKCETCSEVMTVTTDPEKNTYKYGPGLRKMEQDFDPDFGDGAIVNGITDEVRSKILNDPVFRLEHLVEDKRKADSANDRFEALLGIRDAQSRDDFDKNAQLRSIHRKKKQDMKRALNEGHKRGLSIPLAEESSEDAAQAKDVRFHQSEYSRNVKRKEKMKFAEIMSSSIFKSDNGATNKNDNNNNNNNNDIINGDSNNGDVSRKKARIKIGSEATKISQIRTSISKLSQIATLDVKSISVRPDVETKNVQNSTHVITNANKKNVVAQMLSQYDDSD